MKVMEKFGVPEPQWILEQTESGPLYWRRDHNENNSRVKFRFDVEVKEFSPGEHELEDAEWTKDMTHPGIIPMLLTCIFCISVTVFLPWYLIGFYEL